MTQNRLFDYYIKHGTPEQVECAKSWSIAIGLQAVDGPTVSDYLIELAKKNIEGKLTSDEVDSLIDEYYAAKHSEYSTYTRVDQVPDPIEAKRGRPI